VLLRGPVKAVMVGYLGPTQQMNIYVCLRFVYSIPTLTKTKC